MKKPYILKAGHALTLIGLVGITIALLLAPVADRTGERP